MIAQDNPLLQEPYYRDGRTSETERISAPLAAYLPQDARPLVGVSLLIIGLIAFGLAIRSIVAAAIFSAGYAAGHAVGILQPWIDARGWVAILVFSIAGTSAMIRYSNIRSN